MLCTMAACPLQTQHHVKHAEAIPPWHAAQHALSTLHNSTSHSSSGSSSGGSGSSGSSNGGTGSSDRRIKEDQQPSIEELAPLQAADVLNYTSSEVPEGGHLERGARRRQQWTNQDVARGRRSVVPECAGKGQQGHGESEPAWATKQGLGIGQTSTALFRASETAPLLSEACNAKGASAARCPFNAPAPPTTSTPSPLQNRKRTIYAYNGSRREVPDPPWQSKNDP